MTNLNEIIHGVTMVSKGSVKPDENGTSKNYTLKVKFDGHPLKSVFDVAMQKLIIRFANNFARPKYDTWEEGHVFEVDFKAPVVPIVDPRQAYKNELAAKTPAERLAEIRALEAELAELEKAEQEATETAEDTESEAAAQ